MFYLTHNLVSVIIMLCYCLRVTRQTINMFFCKCYQVQMCMFSAIINSQDGGTRVWEDMHEISSIRHQLYFLRKFTLYQTCFIHQLCSGMFLLKPSKPSLSSNKLHI